MRPYFAPGDLLVLTPEPLREIRPGWVISFHAPLGDHRVQTHRVIHVVRGGDHPLVRTKGDANDAADPWVARLHGTTAWRVRRVVPHAGQLVVWLREPVVHDLTVFLVPFLLGLAWIRRIWREPPESGEETSDALPA
jgi:signal peptidase